MTREPLDDRILRDRVLVRQMIREVQPLVAHRVADRGREVEAERGLGLEAGDGHGLRIGDGRRVGQEFSTRPAPSIDSAPARLDDPARAPAACLASPLQLLLPIPERDAAAVRRGATAGGTAALRRAAPRLRHARGDRGRRRDALVAPTVAGVYLCGEGTGYAGGIVSAALDGLAVADAAARDWPG